MNSLEDLRYHVSPSTVVSDILDLKPGTFGLDDAARKVVRQVKNNPLACLLILAGVGWLMLSDNPAVQRAMPRLGRTKTTRASRTRTRRKSTTRR
jgi:hypothetical protein